MPTETIPVAMPDPAAVKAEMLKIYPAKTGKKRGKQIVLNDPDTPPEIAANTRTIPGHHHSARLHVCRLPWRRHGPDL